MKLIDFLEVVNENKNVIVLSANDVELARYDGRNSIPKKYNDKEVIAINYSIRGFYVTIKLLKV